jgi:hypothetical protein
MSNIFLDLRIWIRDLCLFLTPRSVLPGVGLFRNPDIGSRILNPTYFFESLMTIFLVIILRQFLSVPVPYFKIKLLQFCEICGYNKGQNCFLPSSFLPESKTDQNQDPG